MIAILDYERGNLKSVSKALETIGAAYQVTRDPKVIGNADKLIVPGVGAFKDCMTNLESHGLVEPVKDFIRSGRPYLGICLGMQILMEESEEGGVYPGLGLFKGKVMRFSPDLKLKVPHMGWNSLRKEKDSRLLAGIEDESYVYFVHSYYVAPKDKKLVAAVTDYGLNFTSCIEHENVFAVQFHPEKSQKVGLNLLRNFHQLS
jgi:glutamine amidotransferase